MLPVDLVLAHAQLEPSLHKLATYAESRLKAELDSIRPVAVVGRVKDLYSIHQKLQVGRVRSLPTLEDLIGIKIVVLRRSEIAAAAEVVQKSFQFVREKERMTDASDFSYRERHLIVRAPQDYLERNLDLARLVVEVQLTSVVQHALDQATHGFDYKGTSLDWGRRRLVAQLRAALELVDGLLDTMEPSAALLEAHSGALPPDLLTQVAVLEVLTDTFPTEQLPDDYRRLAETIAGWVVASGLETSQLGALLQRHPDLLNATSITASDAVLGALLREFGSKLVAEYEGSFYVSSELATLCAEVERVPSDKRVALLDIPEEERPVED